MRVKAFHHLEYDTYWRLYMVRSRCWMVVDDLQMAKLESRQTVLETMKAVLHDQISPFTKRRQYATS